MSDSDIWQFGGLSRSIVAFQAAEKFYDSVRAMPSWQIAS